MNFPGRDPAQKSLKIWAVWAVFQQDLSGLSGLGGLGGFFGKTAQTAQIFVKKPLKNRSFLAVIFERFFKQDLSSFRAVFERSYKENRLKPTKRPGKVMWPRVDIPKPKKLILNFPTPKKLIIQLPASNVWKNATHTIFIQFQTTIEKRFNLVSPAIWTNYNSLVMKNNKVYFFFWKKKKRLSYNFHIWKLYDNHFFMKGKIFRNCSNLFINKFKLFKSTFAQFKAHCSSKTRFSNQFFLLSFNRHKWLIVIKRRVKLKSRRSEPHSSS